MTETTFELTDIKQTRGSLLRFTGRKIAQTEYETRGRQPVHMLLEIWETKGGAYIAVSDAKPLDGGFEDIRATVIKPSDDEQARRLAVMDAFAWDQRAMKMARKALGWSYVEEID